MKNAEAESCACRLVSVKIPFTAATSGSISEVMNPQAKNSVVTATNAARTVGLLIRYSLPFAGLVPAQGGRCQAVVSARLTHAYEALDACRREEQARFELGESGFAT